MVNSVGIGSQSKLLLTGLAALLISSIGATLGGMYLGSEGQTLDLIPGLMVLLPASINMRGSISGVLASRLSSSMHLGVFEVKFQKDNVLGDNIRASFAVTVILAFVLGLFVNIISIAVGIEIISLVDIVLISLVSGIISGLIVTLITVLVALASFRYGLDLDMIAAPTVTTLGDIVTLPILVLTAIAIVPLNPDFKMIMFGIALIFVLVGIIYAWYMAEPVKAIVKELVPLLIPLSLLGTFAGIAYSLDLERLITFAALLILIPPFMGGCGSIGGILCSRLATGMHMGNISPDVFPRREVAPHFITTYLYSLVLLPLLAVIAHFAAEFLGLHSPGLWVMLMISMGAGLIVMSVVNIIAYFTATMSFRYGLDPDNFGIPVITSSIDLLGAAVLIAVINILL